MNDYIDKARAAWGAAMPDWIADLANACDRASGRKVADRIGYSSTVISRLIGNTYRGDLRECELRFRQALTADKVECPVFGAIDLSVCVRNRRDDRPPINIYRRMCARACPDCLFNTDKKAVKP